MCILNLLLYVYIKFALDNLFCLSLFFTPHIKVLGMINISSNFTTSDVQCGEKGLCLGVSLMASKWDIKESHTIIWNCKK